MSPLTEPTRLVLRKSWQPMDPDAATYIAAVEAADGQALEEKTKIAIDNFVLGCKADGIWTAIKASCILAGARTLAGALVPLAGAAPTRFGTEGGWNYNRKTGLQGNGSNNYLNSNRTGNVDPQNNCHVSAYASTTSTLDQATLIGGGPASSTKMLQVAAGSTLLFRLNNTGGAGMGSIGSSRFYGASRSSSSFFTARNTFNTQVSIVSATPPLESLFIFARENTAGAGALQFGAHRLAFYSIGEALDLALLDARVTDLINAFATAIP